MRRVLLSWSSGKDSAWSLHVLRQMADVEIVGLLTTINQAAQRVAMHAVRRSLLEQQAEATGLPLTVLDLPWPCSNEQYETIMSAACKNAVGYRVDTIAFGDLFLQDIREYREKQLRGTGLEPLFPLWLVPTDRLAREMMQGGLCARLTCVDLKKLPAELSGREWNSDLLAELPENIDPCGENGEFHTFCYNAPNFSKAIAVETGEVVVRDGFAFCDLTAAP